MNKKVYLVDYIGEHCGMHYYLESMRKALADATEMDVEILSNFSEQKGAQPFFVNQYKGSTLTKMASLLKNLGKLRKFVRRNPNDIYIYLNYGNHIDIPFIGIVCGARNHLIDVHEAIAQDVDRNKWLRKKFRNLYSKKIKSLISHSSRTDEFLREFGFAGNVLKVPHFKYTFPKQYEEQSISTELRESLDNGRVNFLFFGNINENKGIDILMDAYNRLSEEAAAKANLIIAGKDYDGSINRVKLLPRRKASILKRHISDDELRYLYQKADYLCLPYRKTSQSGVLEMAFYFRKPIIATDVPYFRSTLEEFPSFGVISGIDAGAYANIMEKVIENHSHARFYIDEDYSRYENRKEIAEFKKDFGKWVSECC